MRVFVTGICGFVGSAFARRIRESFPNFEVFGIDNLMRSGSEANRRLKKFGISVFHGDIRCASDMEGLPAADWVVDAAANPSVLAGVDGRSSSRQLIEHNLLGTVNTLEYCRRYGAGFVLLSTSRVYSIRPLSELPMQVQAYRLTPRFPEIRLPGFSREGVAEDFGTAAPVSLYGATKLASEALALEYGDAFGIPVRVNRCGVLAGAGQFGRAEQGIFSYWLNAWRAARSLRYIGFGGKGLQVRDAFHPDDLSALILDQIQKPDSESQRICNVAGGIDNSMSLFELSNWCTDRFGPRQVTADPDERRFDIPWMVLDNTRVREQWDWKPSRSISSILTEIADHAETHPEWLEFTAG